ncbi:MAG: biotin transporter BioY [Gammaproteobacteria bacterium]|nr:biotin transporter BioY [Gammaproteobacteria bacterium]
MPARPLSWTVPAAQIVAGSLVVAALARLAYVLPFTPVPVTGLTLGVLLVGAALGSRRGAAALTLYLAQGAAGLPVFAGGGAGVAWLLGPTAGYLWSAPLAAWVVGRLAEKRWDRTPSTAFLAMLAGNASIYAVALPWLGLFVGPGEVVEAGLFPFIVGDLVKAALATALLPTAWRIIGPAGSCADHRGG